MENNETLIWYGSEVKAMGQGKVGGYLVRYGDENNTDVSAMRDFFQSDTDFGNVSSTAVLYNHGLDEKLGNRKIGDGTIKSDEVGVWIEAQLNMRDKYEQAIYSLAEKGKLGWSSGTAGHLVRRKKVGNANKILSWPLGLDASLTPTPAEPRNIAVSYKSITNEIDLESEAESLTSAAQLTESQTKQKETKMEAVETKKEVKADLDVKSVLDELAQSIKDRNEAEEAKSVQKAELMQSLENIFNLTTKSQPADETRRAKVLGGNLNLKTKLGDDAFKAFNHYLKSGDPGGIRTGEAYDEYMKTTYTLVEGTQYQGQEVVPIPVLDKIHARRDPLSIARAAGAEVIQIGSSSTIIPIEKNNPEKFVITSETSTYDQLTQQPLDKVTATAYNFTKSVPISIQLLDDSAASVENWWSDRCARAMAITENYNLVSIGTGSGAPQAALVGSTLGVTAASTSVVTAAEVVSLYHAVPAEYRDNVSWVMSGTKEAAVRGLTASTSFPFVGNGGFNGGVGVTGMNQGSGWLVAQNTKVFNDSQMPASTTGLKTILCGNFQAGYTIVERKGLTILRDPFTLATTGYVNFVCNFRLGGAVTNAVALYHLIQA